MLREIREKIQGRFEFNDLGYGIVQKRIALEPGSKHTIMHLDYMDDNGFGWATSTTQGMQVYLTNYPVRVEDNRFVRSWSNGEEIGGPYAGDNAVLYKRQAVYNNTTGVLLESEFPNNYLSGQETFTFYSNQLYLTIIHYRTDEAEPLDPYGGSIYLALDSVEVDPVEYGMGVLGEWSDHMWTPFTKQGVGISNGEIRGGMPLWRLAGHRPQIMGLGVDVGVFYENFGAAEEMYTSALIRDTYVPFARAMGPGPDSPFGTAGVNVPDWYRNAVKEFPELTIGDILPQFPPRLKEDNGNIRMV